MGRYNSLPYCRAWCGFHAMVITSIGTVEANKGRAPSQTSRQNAMATQETHDWPFKVYSKDFFSALPNSCDSRLAIQSEFRRFLLRTKPGRPYLASDLSPNTSNSYDGYHVMFFTYSPNANAQYSKTQIQALPMQ